MHISSLLFSGIFLPTRIKALVIHHFNVSIIILTQISENHKQMSYFCFWLFTIKKGSNTLLARILPPFHTSNTASFPAIHFHTVFLKNTRFYPGFFYRYDFQINSIHCTILDYPVSIRFFPEIPLHLHILQCSFLQAVFFPPPAPSDKVQILWQAEL